MRGKRLVLGDPPPPGEPRNALGYGLGFGAAMVTGIAFIAAKPVLGYLDPLSFSITQFGIATLFSFGWLVAHRQTAALKRVTPGQWTFLVVVSLLFLGAVYTMWIGLSRIAATAAALLNRLEVLVTVFLGMALLGDRFRRREAWGALVMFLGVVVLRYQAPDTFGAGFWMMILSSMLFGVVEVLVKTRVHAIPPDIFVFARNALVFLFFFVAAVWSVAMQEGSWWRGLVDWPGIRRGLPLIATCALAGPFLARTLYTHSVRYLEVSMASIVQQSQPFFVALFSALLLHTLPARREWTGGLLIIAGALLLVSWRAAAGLRRWRGPEEEPVP